MHLIGLKLKAMHDLCWVADFRDPWSDWDILDLFHLTGRSRKIHKKMEEKVIRGADAVISVSDSWAGTLQHRYGKSIEVITNGYDQRDFEDFSKMPEKDFRILHAGLLNSFRNRTGLWKILEELLNEDPRLSQLFKLVLAGNVTDEVTTQLDQFPMLAKRTIVLGYISHDELIHEYSKASALLLLQNDTGNSKGHIPAKVFEYLATKLPVIALGTPESDLGKILEVYNILPIHAVDNDIVHKESILKIFNAFVAGKSLLQPKVPEIFQRKNLTKSLAELLDTLEIPTKN
jgi:glycosyltransferase involved in cell wall biosynthesis